MAPAKKKNNQPPSPPKKQQQRPAKPPFTKSSKKSSLNTPGSHLPGTPEAKRAAKKRSQAKAKGLPTETDTLTAEAEFTRKFKDGEATAAFADTSSLAAGGLVPTAPTVQLIKAMADLVKHGAHADTAARCVGVNARVFRHWCELGIEDPESIYGNMLRALDAADAQDEITDIQLITLGIKNWQALAWKRERKTAKRWQQRVAVGVTMVEEVLENGARVQNPSVQDPAPETILETFERLGLLNRVAGAAGVQNPMDQETNAPDPAKTPKAGTPGWTPPSRNRPT